VEFGGRFGDFPAVKRDHLRGFIIRHADRILFGTDFTPSFLKEGIEAAAEEYHYKFQLLESGGMVERKSGKAATAPYRGLELPRDVLEKIYYRNAVRIYPRLTSVLEQQGFRVE
jgi:predicted TIM-barrel fold metal-dependent hydrolase